MATINASQLNQKIKLLPANLLQEVNDYIEFLAFKHSQENQSVPEWHKDIVLERMEDIKQNPNLLINEDQFWKDFENES